MCQAQQPLNDAQTPAQPLGYPTSVLAQRRYSKPTSKAVRHQLDCFAAKPQAFHFAQQRVSIPSTIVGEHPKAQSARRVAVHSALSRAHRPSRPVRARQQTGACGGAKQRFNWTAQVDGEWNHLGNDPAAGSPTATLLRLLPGSSHCD